MLFRRSLIREMSALAAALFVALLLLVATSQLIRFLGQAASGQLSADAVLAMLGFSALGYFPILLTLTLFISVLLTLTRAYRDSEMAIWFAAGLPITAWVRPVLAFATPIALLIALVSLWLGPLSVQKSREYLGRLAAREEIAALTPGQFHEAQGQRVYFIDAASDQGDARNIFVHWEKDGRTHLLTAGEGMLRQQPNGDRVLDLAAGHRYELTTSGSGLAASSTDFESASLLAPASRYLAPERIPQAMASDELLASGSAQQQAEFAWRLAMPVSALLLALLAVPLAFANPRLGRSFNLVGAILLYLLYFNLLNLVQAWLVQGRLPAVLGMWPVHGAMAVLALLLYRRRLRLPKA